MRSKDEGHCGRSEGSWITRLLDKNMCFCSIMFYQKWKRNNFPRRKNAKHSTHDSICRMKKKQYLHHRKLTCPPKRDYFRRTYIWTNHQFSRDMLVISIRLWTFSWGPVLYMPGKNRSIILLHPFPLKHRNALKAVALVCPLAPGTSETQNYDALLTFFASQLFPLVCGKWVLVKSQEVQRPNFAHSLIESFTWIILKTILCLVLDFEGKMDFFSDLFLYVTLDAS